MPYETLSPTDVDRIHEASMGVLADVGIQFHDDTAVAIFKQHGARVDGRTVYLSEKMVLDAVAAAPDHFTIHARNPARDVTIGQGEPCFVPGYGAPFILDEDGRRYPTIKDYDNLVRLADALPNQDLSGRLLVQPGDLPPCSAHLRLTYGGMVNSEKPFMGSAEGSDGARHTMEMAAILFGKSADELADKPVTIALLDSTSPLRYSEEISGALIEYARRRQPVLVAALIMAGATGPITLAGVLAQQNAEILAGITLAQLVNPGTPVVYGATSAIMDMRSGSLSMGSPEMGMLVTATAQMARRYGLPCRSGGSLTDAHTLDMQAGFESMLGLLTAVHADVDFILHAGGILSAYLAFSYEKFIVDDELCGMMRHMRRGIPVEAETLAADVIGNVGPGGNFLRERHTLQRCRTEFWQPQVWVREDVENWLLNGRIQTAQRARKRWQTLLEEHQPPPLDPLIDRRLQTYIRENGC